MGQAQGPGGVQKEEQKEEQKEVTLEHIQELYRRFSSECPSGKLHLHEVRRIFGISSGSTAAEAAYMDTVFRSFDSNGDGSIDFMEYVAALHLLLRGRLQDRLRWSFKVYDRDGNGCLDRQEVTHLVTVIHSIRKHSDPSASGCVEDVCDRIFDLVDKNKDSQISLEEFIEGAERDSWVMEQLKLDIGACDWFIDQKEKNA